MNYYYFNVKREWSGEKMVLGVLWVVRVLGRKKIYLWNIERNKVLESETMCQ